MTPEVRAVIDVGTNSVKLLVATVDGSVILPLEECSEQTRLGQGFYDSHRLQPGAIDHTAKAVASFAEKARVWNPATVSVVATSAARDAVNRAELVTAIEQTSGLQVNVISGEQEADWAFEGVATDPALASRNLLVIDIGGGSTEFTAGRHGARQFGRSFNLGTLRFLERARISDPPDSSELATGRRETREILESQVKPLVSPVLERLGNEFEFVGTGGTNTIIARIHRGLRSFRREMIDGATLSRSDVQALLERLWTLPLEARRQVIGLPANRADVILPGIVIVHEVMNVFSIDTLRISTRGLRFAALTS